MRGRDWIFLPEVSGGGHVFWLTGRGYWIGNEVDVLNELLVMDFRIYENGDISIRQIGRAHV